MRIDERTTYAEYLAAEPYIKESDRMRVGALACKKFGEYYALDFDTFFGLLSGDWSLLGDLHQNTALQVVWAKEFEAFVTEFAEKIKRLTIAPTEKQERARIGTYNFDYKTSVLVFLRNYFGLHSFAEAGRLTVGEYLTARQDEYNRAVMQRNYERMQREEIERNRRRK